MESFVLAQSYAENAKNNIDVGILYLSMAYLYMDIFDYETALEYSRKAEVRFQDLGDSGRMASALLSSISKRPTYMIRWASSTRLWKRTKNILMSPIHWIWSFSARIRNS